MAQLEVQKAKSDFTDEAEHISDLIAKLGKDQLKKVSAALSTVLESNVAEKKN